jgi:putative transposase
MDELKIFPGERVDFQGRPFVITRLLDLTNVLAEEIRTGKLERLPIQGLVPFKEEVETLPVLKQEFELLTDEQWQVAQKRFAIIRPFLTQKGGGSKVKKATEIATKSGVHLATIYRWIDRYEATGLVSSLADREGRGGKGKSRLTPSVEAIIKATIDTYYLDNQRPSTQRTCLEVIHQCRNAGLEPPHPNTIRNRIIQISGYNRLKYRYSTRTAQEKYKPLEGSFPNANHPLSVVQIDHTKLDIILVDEIYRKPVGRPWITLAIDVFSRVVLGFHISFDPPGAMGTGLCVAHAILPKEQWLAKLDVPGEWPCWGVMQSLHLDNAKEFRGSMLAKACVEYNIDILWRPVAKPEWGGHIERLLGTLSKEIHTLPGTTFSNIQQRKDYDSQAKAALTLSELEKWLTTYIIGVYHHRIHSALGTTPLTRYKEGIFGVNNVAGTGLPTRLLDERKLKLDWMPYVERSVQEYGVIVDHIHYYHDVLRRWIHSLEPGTGKAKVKRKFIFKRDPRDISTICFLDPDLKEYYPIPYRDTSRPSITIWEYRQVCRRLKQQGQTELEEEGIFQAYRRMRELENKAIQQTRQAKRKPTQVSIPIQAEINSAINNISAEPNEKPVQKRIIKPFDELEDGTFKSGY